MSDFIVLAQAGTSGDEVTTRAIIGMFVFFASLFLGVMVVQFTTRAGIIMRATTKEAIRQPVFWFLLFVAILSLIVNTFLPFFTLGDDIKMLKDCGLATILISGLLLAAWTSSTSIANEIEGKTAMTLLSKPINRRQFIIGKFLGIIQAAAIMIVPLTIIFCLLLFYKVGYDARESSETVPDVMDFQTMTINQQRLEPVVKTLPGVVLIFLEICVLTAISVAISTRAPMVVNIISCLAIFVIGHLTPVLVHAGVLKIEFVQFMARLIATILPSLEVFNIQAAVATDRMIPPNYMSTSAAYSVCYCAAAILLAFTLFEDRDLA